MPMDLNTFASMVNQQKIMVLVSNDLSTDERVRKTCNSLINQGFDIELTGRKLPGSVPLNRPYKTKRFDLWFNKGAFFYATLNTRLFFYLLFAKYDRIHANDLDTLLPAYLVSKLRNKTLVYDSHEVFSEVPEIQDRWVKKVWLALENSILPKLKSFITVNPSIAAFYGDKYNRDDIHVIRNIPEKKEIKKLKSRKELDLPDDRFIIIVQGAGINVDRGTEEVLHSLKYSDDILLLIVGSGDAIPGLKKIAKKENLEEKVRFISRMPYEQMMQYTMNADLGITVDKPTSLNYKLSLPNKIFDYIRAGIPVLASNLVEVARIVNQYNVGIVIPEVEPKAIAAAIQKFRDGTIDNNELKINLKRASDDLNWEHDAEVLKTIYGQ
jgi:glycosyltransferase involved in cell wall biosynthesis